MSHDADIEKKSNELDEYAHGFLMPVAGGIVGIIAGSFVGGAEGAVVGGIIGSCVGFVIVLIFAKDS